MKSNRFTYQGMPHKILVILLCFGQLALGQTKNEKEERIKLSSFPMMAQKVIETLPKDCKRLKFYKETDGEKHSFEAKFKYQGQRYSLEFSESGSVEDIEVETKLKAISAKIGSNIESYFDSTYTKHKLIKIQEQYVYASKISASRFIAQVLRKDSGLAPNFEIIAEVKTNKERYLGEFTFNTEGTFISFRTINPGAYEHVLY